MIEVEGRVIPGLDEFMLRLGHLVTLARVAHEAGASWRRINREAASRLAANVTVSPDRNRHVAEYLFAKELCRRAPPLPNTTPNKDLRYPNLELSKSDTGNLRVSALNAAAVQVSWQDRNLADPRVTSKVGALTWSGKAGSKTGLSHVADWAQFLELINSAGQATPIGRLLVNLTGAVDCPYESWNPYVVGPERLFIAYEYFRKDFDLFARFGPLLAEARSPLTKTHCRELFVTALKEVVKDAEKSRLITSRGRFELNQQLRDLERAAKRSDRRTEETSTAWHRAASRVETLTDIGLLDKGRGGEKERYQYVYYITDRLKAVVGALPRRRTAVSWIDEDLSEATIGDSALHRMDAVADVVSDLRIVVRALSLPTTLFPIDCLALGVVYLHANRGELLPLTIARNALEALAVKQPELARLARGREGTRADFLSIDMRKI